MPCFYMTTHTTLSDAARALRRSCPVSLVTRHSPLVTAFLIATLPSSKVRPSSSKQRALKILIATLNTFPLRPSASDRRPPSTNHVLRNRLSKPFQTAATPSKSIECNFEIDRLIGGRVPIARPYQGGTDPYLKEENGPKSQRDASPPRGWRIFDATWRAELPRRSFRQEIAEEEDEVGGALGEAAHEVGEPIGAEGDIDAEAVAIADELPLQVGADAVEHLKFELFAPNIFRAREFLRRPDHRGIVRGDAVVNAAREQQLHELHVIRVHVFFFGEANFGRFFVSALAETQAAGDCEQVLHILLGAIEVGLHHGAHGRVFCAHALRDFDGALRIGRAFHINAHEISQLGGVRDDLLDQFLAQRLAEIEAQLRELQGN